MKKFCEITLAGLLLAAGLTHPAFGATTIISDGFNVISPAPGFELDNGINSGINPPTTRLTGTAAANLRYYQTVTNKPAAVYDIFDNALRIQTNSSVGRFTFSEDGITPFNFASALGTANATPTNPVVYDIKISMRNDSTTAARFTLGLATAEGDVNVLDFGLQLYRASAANTFYTIRKRINTASSGVANVDAVMTTTAANTVTTFIPFLIRVTDAGAESDTNYNSRVQVSTDNGATWIYDTDTDTTTLPNGWRLDAPGRYFVFDIAGNASADVFYDEFSVELQPVWNGGGSDDKWSTGANWTGSAPNAGNPVIFAGSTRLAPLMDEDYTVSTLTFFKGASSFNISATEGKTLTLNGDIFQSSGSLQTLNTPISIASTRIINTSGGNLILGGVISGTGGITKAAVNELTLNGLNTYSGPTRINRGTVFINSITNVGAGASSLGAPATTVDGTINLGSGTTASSLRYTGTGHSTDRVINLSSGTGGLSIYSSGTGPLIFTSDFTATGGNSKTLSLRGVNTGSNTIGGAIVDNSAVNKTALTKTDAGKWILEGVNTYSGNTTVSQGTLLVNGSIAAESPVTVASAATLGGSGNIGGTVSVTGTISPGNGIGSLTTGPQTWNSNAKMLWEIGNTGSDQIVATSLNIQGTTVTIDITALEALTGWDNTTAKSWTIVHTTEGGIANFDANKFVFVDNFSTLNSVAGGTFTVASDGTDLVLQFSPGTGGDTQPRVLTAGAAGVASFTGIPNTGYTVQYTDSLNPISWQTLITVGNNGVVTTDSGGAGNFQDPAAPAGSQRYYRILNP